MDTENVQMSDTGHVSSLGKALGLNDNPLFWHFFRGSKLLNVMVVSPNLAPL